MELRAGSLDEVEEELTVAFRSRQARVYDPGRLGSPGERCLGDLPGDSTPGGRIADDAPADVLATGFELRLHEHDRLPTRRGELQQPGERLAHADERDVADDELRRERQLADAPRICPFEDDDARVLADPRVQLAVANVQRDHACCAALEQNVGEAAGGGADVEAGPPGRIDAEGVEGVGELGPSPRDVGLSLRHRQLRGLVHLLPRLLVPRHPAGEQERLRLGAALRKPALDQEYVNPFLHAPMIVVVATELQGEMVRLRPLEPADVERLTKIGAEPEVTRWWGEITREHLLDKAEGRDDATAFAIEHEGDVVGLAQFSEPGEDEFEHANMDLFLTSSLHGRGLGRDVVRTLARWLIDERGHHRLTIDPALANEPAIRAYEAVGFKRVGVMRRYWRDPEGVWQDGLLLDLLADEL
jgi:aminoglycoside 6'-N-acetyltransferase